MPKPEIAFVGGFIGGGVLGAGFGALIGSGSKSPVWKEIPVSKLESMLSDSKQSKKSAQSNSAIRQKTGVLHSQKEIRNWSFFATLGTSSGGPANDIENAMVNQAFDGTSPGNWFWGGDPTHHPYSKIGLGQYGFPWSLSLRNRFRPRWELGFLISNTVIGGTEGYHEASMAHLELKYKVFTLAPVFYFKLFRMVKFGVGPAVYRTHCQQLSADEIVEDYDSTLLGAVIDMRLTSRESMRLFVELTAQYRMIPQTSVGPFIAGDSEEIFMDFDLNYSHLFIGLGLGIRL